MIMLSYTERRLAAEAELAEAKAALGRDFAAALLGKNWSVQLRDKYDLGQFLDRVDEMVRPPEFFKQLHAAADHARQAQGRSRGRPKKSPSPSAATKPAAAKVPARSDVGTQS